jgi:hypothetical protein
VFVAGRLLGVAVSLAGMLAASGCGDAGSTRPRSLPPATATPVGDAASESPSYDEGVALDAATAVVREYFRLVNDLKRSMDPKPLAELMARDCACRAQLDAISAAAERGQHFVDHALHLKLRPALNDVAAADVLAIYDTLTGGLVDANGHVVTKTKPRTDVKRLFRLSFSAAGWHIDEISAVT